MTENGQTMAGGYGEDVLKSYSVTADVNASTYGIKTATKNSSGFSFSKANETSSQTGSGIAGQELKTVTTASSPDSKDGVYVMVGGSKDETEAAVSEQIGHMTEAIEKLAYAEGVAENKVTLKPTKAAVKAKALKKAAKTVTIKASAASGAKVTYSSSKGISVSKNGKVTIKKGTKKGTYTVTSTAAETAGFKSASAVFTVKVK